MRVGVHCDIESCNDTRLWALDFLECDAQEILGAKKAARGKLEKTLESRGQGLTLVTNFTEAFDDGTMAELLELCADFRAEALALRCQAAADPAQWMAAWKTVENAPPLFLDPLDPFDADDPATSNYWRVNDVPKKTGIKELTKLTLLYYPDWVVLAHPGRLEEAADFKGRLI
jgi:hypothetical protein